MNKCVTEYGCRGSCCRGKRMVMSVEDFIEFSANVANRGVIPHTITPSDVGGYNASLRPDGPSEIYEVGLEIEDQGLRHFVFIFGACPLLDLMTGDCSKYDNRPGPCRNLQIGSTNCNKARQRDGLNPIS